MRLRIRSARSIWFRALLSVFAVASLALGAAPATAGGAVTDSSAIIFDSNRSGNYEIFSYNRNSSQTNQITSNTFYDSYFPRLSGDRSKILFVRSKKGDHNRGPVGDVIVDNSIWSMSADGSNLKAVVCTPFSQLASGDTCANTYPALYLDHPWWSPDGNRFVLTAGIGGGQPAGSSGKIYILSADGTNPAPLYDTGTITQLDPSWGWDGSSNPPVEAIWHVRCPQAPCTIDQTEVYSIPVTGG